jgi:hypothetical protein
LDEPLPDDTGRAEYAYTKVFSHKQIGQYHLREADGSNNNLWVTL